MSQMPRPPTYVVLGLDVMLVHELEQPHFDLCLVEERFLVLDDLYGDLFLVHTVVRLHHLTETERVITVYIYNFHSLYTDAA